MIPPSPLSHPPVNYLQGQQGIVRHQPPSLDSPVTPAAGVPEGMSPASSPVKTPYIPNGGGSYGFGSPVKPGFGPCQANGSPAKAAFGLYQETGSPVKPVSEGSSDGWSHQQGQYWQQGSYSGYGGYSGQNNSDTPAQQGSQYQGYQGYHHQ